MAEIADSLPDRPLTLNEVKAIANIDSIDILYHFDESTFDDSVFEYASVDNTEDGIVMVMFLIDRKVFVLTYEGEWQKDLLGSDMSKEEFKVTGDLVESYGNRPDELEGSL